MDNRGRKERREYLSQKPEYPVPQNFRPGFGRSTPPGPPTSSSAPTSRGSGQPRRGRGSRSSPLDHPSRSPDPADPYGRGRYPPISPFPPGGSGFAPHINPAFFPGSNFPPHEPPPHREREYYRDERRDRERDRYREREKLPEDRRESSNRYPENDRRDGGSSSSKRKREEIEESSLDHLDNRNNNCIDNFDYIGGYNPMTIIATIEANEETKDFNNSIINSSIENTIRELSPEAIQLLKNPAIVQLLKELTSKK